LTLAGAGPDPGLPWIRAILCIAAALWLAGLTRPASAGLPETVARVKRSILGIGTVQATRRPPGQFTGTGFVVGDGRYAITNAHVVPAKIDRENREVLAVLTGAGAQEGVREATVVSTDPDHDLALLSFKGSPLPALKLAESERVREGERYAFTGFPLGMALGMRPVTHQALVGAITPVAIPQYSARTLDPKLVQRLGAPYDVFQLDATAYPGNSGSPLYDPETGQIVGIINKVFVKETKENLLKEPSGITYAIPAKFAAALLRKAGVPE
jgi:S1-C subfamily serine protease